MTFHDLENLWNNMPPVQNSYVALDTDSSLKLQIGYYMNHSKSFVVEDAGDIDALPSSNAIHAEVRKLNNGTKVLEFQLTESQYDDVFVHLIWDLIESSIGQRKPLRALVKRYITWHKLLQKMSSGILSASSQKGLLGELMYLEKMINESGIERALQAWAGPAGSDQDFIFDNSWTEVKAVSIGAKGVQISSLEQLHQEMDGILYVYILEKTTPGENRLTLPKQVARIRDLIKDFPMASDRFETDLLMAAYKQKDESEYSKNQYRYVEEKEYVVSDAFPKLTSDNVPVGIMECKYTLSFSLIEQFRR